MMIKPFVILAGLFPIFFGIPAYSDIVLADKGQSPVVICVDDKAPDSVQLAAHDLQNYLQQVTGASIALGNQPAGPDKFTIYLGDSDFAHSKGVEPVKLPHDGFKILSGDNWMVIAGRDYSGPPQVGSVNPYRINETYNAHVKVSAFGDTGTLYGVYYFLDTYCGVRWYMPGDLGTVVPKTPSLHIPAVNVQKSPTYEYRYPYLCFFSSSDDDALWYRRVGFGGPYPVEIQHSFGEDFIKYKDSHPEYFAVIDGKPDFTNRSSMGPGNLNLSDPGLLQQAISDINDYFDKHPEASMFSLCPNDGMSRISEDPESQSQIISGLVGGKYSNYVWGFINKVALGVAAKHPDKYVGCIAYEEYDRAPTNLDKMSPNLIVMVCKIRSHLGEPEYRKRATDIINEWKKKGVALYVWEYYCDILFDSGWRGYPVFYPKLQQGDFKDLVGVIKGEFLEAETWTDDPYPPAPQVILTNPGLMSPRLYVEAKLLWDPNLDMASLLSEFYTNFYGPAAPEMRSFWEAIEKSWTTKKPGYAPSSIYSRQTLTTLMNILDEAKAKAPEGSPYRQRIDLMESEFKPVVLKTGRLHKLQQQATTATIPYLGEVAPSIDGQLEPLWSKATPLPLMDTNYQLGDPSTLLRLGWNKDALYVAVSSYEPNMDKLVANAKGRDPVPDDSSDDSIETFIAPKTGAGENRFQFIVNPNGSLWDATLNSSPRPNVEWNSNAAVAIGKSAGCWTMEMAIPWKDLGITDPEAGLELQADVIRNRLAGGEGLREFTWAPMLLGNHADPSNYGKWVLGPEKP
jgi:Domain of unknown function (DUF4838)/Carbohydrate family 9 binding domain-like